VIEPIPFRRVISIRGKLQTVGSEPLHVVCDDYEPYFLKNHKLVTPATDLINEVICHYLLKIWHINTPNVALISLEEETIKSDYGARHRPIYYDRKAFGSKEVEGAFDATDFLDIKGKVDFKKLYRPEMFARIGLFDMWVENEDRACDLKNLMIIELDGRFRFLAIDHTMAFRTGAYETMKEKLFFPTEDNYLLQSEYFRKLKRFLKTDKTRLNTEKENFYNCINTCKHYFDDIATQLPDEWGFKQESKTIISEFLFDEKRNKDVFNEYIRLWQ